MQEQSVNGWLKLVGRSDWRLPDAWAIDRKELLSEVRFSELHPPDAIQRGDRLVYHAVVDRRIIAIVAVTDDEASCDPHPPEWAKQWPLIRKVHPLLRVPRVSQGPSTDGLGELPDLMHQGYVPLAPSQLYIAEELLMKAGAR
jgi:hypothetical protein